MNRKLDIIKSVCEETFDIDLTKRTRKREYVAKRCIYFKIARSTSGASFESIGKSVGRNHATVMHSLKEFEYIIKNDPFYHALYIKVRLKCGVIIKNKFEKQIDKQEYYLHQNINLKAELKEIVSKWDKIPFNVKIRYA